MVVVDLEDGVEVNRQELSLLKFSRFERLEVFCRWGIQTIICAGVSDIMCRLLDSRQIHPRSGIVGEVEGIIQAYCCGNLDDPCFCMPGKRPST
jgi:hypothetical protein